MERFALLLDNLGNTQSRLGKLALMRDYFRTAPDPDRGWALTALTDGLPMRLSLRRALTEIMAERIDPVLYKLSRDYVGDTAETVSLLWPDEPRQGPPPRLDAIVAAVRAASSSGLAAVLAGHLDLMTARERWAYLKLIGGAPRVGVSARLAKTALGESAGREVAEIEEVWHALEPPYHDLFQWLFAAARRPDAGDKPLFRPMMLAHPVEAQDWPSMAPGDFAAEWKWDGIRVQVAAKGGRVRLFSRTGDDISPAFPEVVSAFSALDVCADGELLVVDEGNVAPFNALQQRLNRKTVSARMLREYPAHVRLYDLLLLGGEDLRACSFIARRQRLEAWYRESAPRHTSLSELVAFQNFDELAALRAGARDAGVEGLMLKRKASPYLAGRPRGHWFKWKRDALMLDCVLMYAQRGSGKRSSFYSDYTFGVWRTGQDGKPELVPVGKAYSGFTDAELGRLDRFIRQNTLESFGPVRAVAQQLVLEVAFDAVQASSRHKSGIAMRFPRIHRIRWDKPAAEADTLETARRLIAQQQT